MITGRAYGWRMDQSRMHAEGKIIHSTNWRTVCLFQTYPKIPTWGGQDISGWGWPWECFSPVSLQARDGTPSRKGRQSTKLDGCSLKQGVRCTYHVYEAFLGPSTVKCQPPTIRDPRGSRVICHGSAERAKANVHFLLRWREVPRKK